ncbi:PQQ-binding-like beta-propeller repeat protein [Streptomyces sp. NPDC004610]|uniref:outer membrane protein assembly factor BamB family protein n=1 Tax=unclassified Streptomyces TaxID=2593676 RepID=UPI0033ABC6BD
MSFGPPPSIYTESHRAAEGRRSRRRLRWFGVAGALALLAGAGIGTWLLASPGSSGDTPADDRPAAVAQQPDEIRETVEKPPASPEGRLMLYQQETGLEEFKNGGDRYAPGTWATGEIFAKGTADKILGYDIAPDSEDPAWTLDLDGHLCATSEHVTADGRTAVVVQPPKPDGADTEGVCDQVVFFDIDTGKKLWQSTMPSAGSAFVTNTNLTLTRGVVAIAWGQGSVAYDMKDGRKLWDGTSVSSCEDRGFAGGRALLALLTCGTGANATYRVQRLDPRTGEPEWTYEVARGVQDVYLPSSEPPVLAVAAGDTSVTELITLDDDGTYLATVPMSGRHDPKCGDRYFSSPFFGVVEHCDALVVDDDRLYVATKEEPTPAQPANWIVAFDTATGKTTGKFEGRPYQPVYPLRTSGDELLIIRESLSEVEPTAVVAWNPETDKETPYLLFGLPEEEMGQLADLEWSDIVVEQGRLFLSRRQIEPDAEDPEAPVLASIAIGSFGLEH